MAKRGNPNWGKGKSGNPKGAPKKPEIDLLRDAIEKAQNKRGVTLLDHFVERAYENDKVLIALGKKIIPDLSNVSGDLNLKQKILHCIGFNPIDSRTDNKSE